MRNETTLRPTEARFKSPTEAEWKAIRLAVTCHEDLVGALKALKLDCLADPLNPCWNNRPTDIPGIHWGGGKACTSCNARAALAKAGA